MKRRVFLATLLSFLVSTNVFAALAIDSEEASHAGHGATTTSPLQWNFTNTAGTLLVCTVGLSEINAVPTINSVTYNSVSMTLLDSWTTGTPILPADAGVIAFYYINGSPATGSNQVSVSFTYNSGLDNPNNEDVIAGCISFTGADPTSPFGARVKEKDTTVGTSTSHTTSVTSTTSGNIVIGMLTTGSGGLAVTSPASNSWLLNHSTHTGADNGALATKTSSGGTTSIGWTFTADIWASMALEILASGGGGGPTTSGCGSLSLLHVGCLESN